MAEKIDMSNYTLQFNEQFDSFRLWGESGAVWKTSGYWDERSLPGNGEKQFYIDPDYKNLGINPFKHSNGVLTIQAQKAPDSIKWQIDNMDYTSGMIISERVFSMQYGYFEIKAQMPAGKGLWPGFWLLTMDAQWPPEMDVIETIGQEPHILYGTSHYIDANGKKVEDHIRKAGLFDSSDGFHTYGLDWQKDKLVWYYDGIKVGEFANHTFDQPAYMIANLAVGGYWPGSPNSTTPFPAEMKIDHIRVYQKNVDHAVVGVPKDWAPIGIDAFTVLNGDGAKTTWDVDYTLGSTETKVVQLNDWGRHITGNDKNNYLASANGQYTELKGGKGNDTLLGGKGTDVFIIRNGDGNDTILDLSNSVNNTDKIRLEGFHFTHFDDVKPWLSQVGSDVILRLDKDQALLLKNTSIAKLEPEMFVFAKSVAAPANAPVISEPAPSTGTNGPSISVGTTEAEKLSLSGGYFVEQKSSASGGAQIKLTGSGEASGTFTGDSGSYKITVSYLNEFDGVADFSVKVGGKTVNSWTGSGSNSTDVVQTRSFTINLNQGDKIALAATQGGWEQGRFDWLKIEKAVSGPTIGVGTTEAEKLSLSGGYFVEQKSSASGGAQIKLTGSGEAAGTFTGADGSYKFTVSYLNEFDGAADFAVKVNGATVNSWTGSGSNSTDIVQTRSFTLDLKQGDKIALAGKQGGWEQARFDWVKVEKAMVFSGPTIGLGTTEAEKLSLSGGYFVEQKSSASGGAQIKLTGSGEASGTFTGDSGSYKITVSYLNEFDGVADFSVKVGGKTVNSWTGSGSNSTDVVQTRSFTINLNQGDKIALAATQGGWEQGRFDWLKIEKAASMASSSVSALSFDAFASGDQVDLVGVGTDGAWDYAA
ncbi:family 16 glycosylhydrolase [Indioceanicola profundi]|uniref:family 16 glycosylhydrolase n=1 Tax=Indioceanicola profundi TaxID=2220096 RepID=UPI0013C4C498|nr:family 16 glycosylhydrolase [Indioceanicola profundi]